jgi:hypothetical protein
MQKDRLFMDELLATRYRLLFQNYAIGDTGPVRFLKRRLIEWNAQNGERLRPDAAIFLLVNLDRMLMRPYFGEIFGEGNRLLPLPQELPANEWFERTQRASELLLEYFARSEGEISAHDVLQAIDMNWKLLASMFGWG